MIPNNCNSFYNLLDTYYINNNATVVFNDSTSCDKHIVNNCNFSLKLLHLNIRSINKNFSELCILLQSFSFCFDIIILTETWSNYDIGYDILNFKKFTKPCKYNKCDGIVVYFKKGIEFTTSDVEISNCNSIHFKFKFNQHNFDLTAIYRSPNLNKNDFLNDLEKFLLYMKSVNTHIVVGDINIQILEDKLDIHGHRYMNIMHEFGFLKFLNTITRPSSESCLDHIFYKSNINILKFSTGVYTSDITDHYTIFAIISFVNNNQNGDYDSYHCNSEINYDSLFLDASNENWENIFNCKQPEICLDYFYETLKNIIDKNITNTFRKIPSKFKKIKPWITSGIVKSIRTRDKLANKLKKEPFNINLKNKYKTFRNTLTNLIKIAKINYYSKKFETHRNNPKMFWKTVREAANINTDKNEAIKEINTQNGLVHTDNVQIATEFNNYFSNIGSEIASTISNNGVNSINLTPVQTSMYLYPISEEELINLCKTLKNNTVPGLDLITSKLLKTLITVLSKPLAHIFNLCFLTGVFPKQFKTAIIKPIYKSGDKKT